jgi:hypothetical protein
MCFPISCVTLISWVASQDIPVASSYHSGGHQLPLRSPISTKRSHVCISLPDPENIWWQTQRTKSREIYCLKLCIYFTYFFSTSLLVPFVILTAVLYVWYMIFKEVCLQLCFLPYTSGLSRLYVSSVQVFDFEVIVLRPETHWTLQWFNDQCFILSVLPLMMPPQSTETCRVYR